VQAEVRAYADTVFALLKPHLPGLMRLFDSHFRRL